METEVQAYLTEIRSLKEQVRETLKGLDDAAGSWQPLSKDTNSIYSIIAHLTGSENYMIRQIIFCQTVQRDRAAEFNASGNLAKLIAEWEKQCKANEDLFSKLMPGQLDEMRKLASRPEPVTVRWVILHFIEHYAVHLGHIQLTRQLWHARKL